MNRTSDKIVLFIAQGGFSGRMPIAPGTAGTVVGVLLYLLVKDLSSLWYSAVFVIVTLIGTWAAGAADRVLGTKDSPTIVIDEIAGYLLVMSLIPFAWWAVIAGFVLFRFFDILKPWPINKLQDIPGGPGVMLDDIAAAVYTNIVLQAVMYLAGRS